MLWIKVEYVDEAWVGKWGETLCCFKNECEVVGLPNWEEQMPSAIINE